MKRFYYWLGVRVVAIHVVRAGRERFYLVLEDMKHKSHMTIQRFSMTALNFLTLNHLPLALWISFTTTFKCWAKVSLCSATGIVSDVGDSKLSKSSKEFSMSFLLCSLSSRVLPGFSQLSSPSPIERLCWMEGRGGPGRQ